MNTKYLNLITGAYFSGKGYLVELQPDIVGDGLKPDIIAVKPIERLLRLRIERGAAPAGILHLLDKKKEKSIDYIIRETGYREDFVRSVLKDSEKEGWVESKNAAGGKVTWVIKDYAVPVRECVYVCCGLEHPLRAVDILKQFRGSYHKGYIVFPYSIDDKFLHDCHHEDIGVLVFDEKRAGFYEPVKAHRLKITNKKAFYSVCEKIIVNHCVSPNL